MSFTREKRDAIKKYILDKISASEPDFVKRTAEAYSITTNTVYRYIRELIKDNIITKDGKNFSLTKKDYYFKLSMTDIAANSEDSIFLNYVLPQIQSLEENAINIWNYCFTEMMNNVIDHSQADEVNIFISLDYMNTYVLLQDNGIGIFEKIKSHYNFSSIDDAILELFKGKLTTDHDRHSGEGIFFSSRIMDVFAAISGGKIFSHTEFDEIVDDLSAFPKINDNPLVQNGTTILMRLSNHTNKTIKEIMDRYADIDGGFIRTIIPIKNIYPGYPVSRSQAKRLTHRFESFKEVQLDFEGVSEIGQGFAHELFVVYRQQHPEVEIIPYNTNSTVQRMITHVAGQ